MVPLNLLSTSILIHQGLGGQQLLAHVYNLQHVNDSFTKVTHKHGIITIIRDFCRIKLRGFLINNGHSYLVMHFPDQNIDIANLCRSIGNLSLL